MIAASASSVDAADYFPTRPSDGVIGPDGFGALDLDRSEVWLDPPGEEAQFLQRRVEPRPAPGAARAVIAMRPRVREFSLTYFDKLDTLLVREDLFEAHRALIEPSLTRMEPVACRFGEVVRDYIWGTLRVRDVWRTQIDWAASSFLKVPFNDYMINFTKVGRGEVEPDHMVPVLERDVLFTDCEAWREEQAKTIRVLILPEVLRLRVPTLPAILNLSVTQTLVTGPIRELLPLRSKANRREPGLVTTLPSVRVERSADAERGVGSQGSA